MEIFFLALIKPSRGEGSFSQISMPVMVVTLPVVFDGFKDHGKNKQSQQ